MRALYRTGALCLLALLLGVVAACSPSTSAAIPTATAHRTSTMLLGSGFAKDAQEKLSIVGPKTAFNAGDTFVYVVTLPGQFGVTQVTGRLMQLDGAGAPKSLGTFAIPVSDPTFTQLAQKWSNVDKLMKPCAGTHFELDMLNNQTLLAHATFTYSGC
ncbi:MAG: hypothetical protein ACHQ4H_13125 [Ktedonobacterales bacterium]